MEILGYILLYLVIGVLVAFIFGRLNLNAFPDEYVSITLVWPGAVMFILSALLILTVADISHWVTTKHDQWRYK